MSKQLQFELWQECNSRCRFCYLGTENRCTPTEVKISALQKTLAEINKLENYEEYDTLAYLGGEFFQGQLNDPTVKDLFMQVMQKTADLLNAEYIEEAWIYVTLTLGDQADLYETLKLFEGCKGKLWILTSYDTLGRFHTPKMEDNWKFHMKKMHELYPNILFNTTTILSEDCIDKYLNDELSFSAMMKEYHTTFFFKQCGVGEESPAEFNKKLPGFVPPRQKFLDFLMKFRQREDDVMWDKLFNIHYRADMLYRNTNDIDNQMVANVRHKDSKAEVELNYACKETQVGKCGHLVSYQAYCDCDGCVLCDKQMIEELY